MTEAALSVGDAIEAENGQSLADAVRERKEARRKLWERGILGWKFAGYPWAKDMYEFTRARWGASPYIFWFVHRRGAKSTTGLVIALEECLRAPNTRCAVICKTKEQAQEICDLSMDELLSDCPKSVMPRLVKNQYTYYFKNGSRIVILPLDGKHGLKARGRKFRFVLVTEAGFIDNVNTILASSILPAMNDVRGIDTGTVVLESTPPEDADHPMEDMVEAARADDRLYYLPLSANTHASEKFVKKAQTDSGGAENVIYLREYELQFVVNTERVAIPEATVDRLFKGDPEKKLPEDDPSRGLPPLVRELVCPNESDHYESLDPGGTDLTGWLGASYLFEHDLVYIEDEITFHNMTTDAFATKVRAKEVSLWGERPRGRIRRYGDSSNKRFLYDLHVDHKLYFMATAKDDKGAQINKVRLMVRAGRLAIHPRCKLLIKTLRTAKVAKDTRRGFERGDEIGHADLLDCLIYLVRNVNRRELPKAPDQRPVEAQVRAPPPVEDKQVRALSAALGLNRFRR